MDARQPYPVRIEGELDPSVSRWLWLVKWLLAIPHYIVLAFLWVTLFVLTVVVFFAILITGRYPRGIFDFNLGVLRWTWRVGFYSYAALGTDRYPPFTLGEAPDYPARLDIAYPERLSRGLVLVKWWLLAIPHYIVVGILMGGGSYAASRAYDRVWGFGYQTGLIGVLVFFAVIQIMFYVVLDARRQNLIHSVFVFDIGGMSALTGENLFPGNWSPGESIFIADGCYQPAYWDTYWWMDPCSWVMDRLDSETADHKKLFGTPELQSYWLKTVLAHPVAYLHHRFLHFTSFLTFRDQQTIEYDTVDAADKPGPRNPAFSALRALHDAWQRTFIFLPGFWLLFAVAAAALAWRERASPGGTYVLGVTLAALAYLGTFFFLGVASAYRYAYWPVLADLTSIAALAAAFRRQSVTPLIEPSRA